MAEAAAETAPREKRPTDWVKVGAVVSLLIGFAGAAFGVAAYLFVTDHQYQADNLERQKETAAIVAQMQVFANTMEANQKSERELTRVIQGLLKAQTDHKDEPGWPQGRAHPHAP